MVDCSKNHDSRSNFLTNVNQLKITQASDEESLAHWSLILQHLNKRIFRGSRGPKRSQKVLKVPEGSILKMYQ